MRKRVVGEVDTPTRLQRVFPGNHKEFVINSLLSPLGAIYPWLTSDERNPWSTYGFACLVIAVGITTCYGAFLLSSHAVGYTPPLQIANVFENLSLGLTSFALLSLLFNLAAIPFLYVCKALEDFQRGMCDHLTLATKQSRRNTRHIQSSVDRILGHKVWAGEKTFGMLNAMMSQRDSTRAKWFMVNFLSTLAEDSITPYKRDGSPCKAGEPSDYYKISTRANRWTDCTYSRFLSENMDHAETSILWAVDPEDFFENLLPWHFLYIIVGFGKAVCNYDFHFDIGSDEIQNAADIFDLMDSSPFAKCRPARQDISMKGMSHDERIRYFSKSVLPMLLVFGIEAIQSGDKKAEPGYLDKIISGYRTVCAEPQGQYLPHIEAFRTASASERRLRAICLYYKDASLHKSGEHTGDPLYDAIRDNWDRSAFHEDLKRLGGKSFEWLDNEQFVSIMECALRLFAFNCGDEEPGAEKNVSVFSVTDRCRDYDIGIYDSCFVVKTIVPRELEDPESTCADKRKKHPVDSDRIVDWYYYPDTDVPPHDRAFFERPSHERLFADFCLQFKELLSQEMVTSTPATPAATGLPVVSAAMPTSKNGRGESPDD